MLVTFHGTLAAKITPTAHGLPNTYFVFAETGLNGEKKQTECIRIHNSINVDNYEVGERLKLLIQLFTRPAGKLICQTHPAYLPRKLKDATKPIYDPVPLHHRSRHTDLMSFTLQGVVTDRLRVFKFSDGSLRTVGHNFLMLSQRQINGSYCSVPVKLSPGLNLLDYNKGETVRTVVTVRLYSSSIRSNQSRIGYFVDANYPPSRAIAAQ